MALIRPRVWKAMAQVAVIALAAGAGPTSAQDMDNAGPEMGAPQDIVPEQMPEGTMPSNMGSRPGGAVVVGDLGTIEGPVAGTLDNSHGGLGYEAWQGSDRATMETMLLAIPPATPSAAARELLRKLLLTIAPPPAGRADLSFNALRLTRLMDGGLADDAADLAVTMQAPMNMEILRAQADALVSAGRDVDACGDVTATRLDSADPYWAELRAYCYAVAGDKTALELTRNVIEEQGLTDPSFLTLLDGTASGKPTAPEVIRIPDAIHILMMARLKLPMPREIALDLGLSATLIAAASPETPKAVRVAAAEKALRAGILPPAVLDQILDLTTFTPQDLIGAPALARTEPLMTALSRLRAAVKITPVPVARADFIHAAFEIGEREGLLAQIAGLFADDASAIVPAHDWNNWSDLMMRGLLLAGKPEAALRWYQILDPRAPVTAELSNQLHLELALAEPNTADALTTSAVLLQMAQRANPAPLAGPRPTQAVVARTTLNLGLYEALGRPMPTEARMAVEPLVTQQSQGRRPPPALMQRIDKASLAGAKAEVALSVLAALGPRGAGDLAPDVVVKLVRALQTAGIRDAAHALALEAMLLRPAGV